MNSLVDVSGPVNALLEIREDTIAQRLLFPDQSINSEVDLYYHSPPTSGMDYERGHYFVKQYDLLQFDSYFNAFPLYAFDIDAHHTLSLRLKGRGKCTLLAYKAYLNESWELIQKTRISLNSESEAVFPLYSGEGDNSLIYFGIVAETDVELDEADYIISGPRRNKASITGVITTYKRDEAVQKTAKRLQDYFSLSSDLKSDFNLVVVDNGGDTDTIPFEKGQVIKNKNYGGAGGFSRGLLEAVDKKLSTHVLFMDDDAVFHPETIRRTLAVLWFSRRPNLAISGAMITEQHPWMMWENSATFNRRCKPLHNGKDLRDFINVISCALDNPPATENRYGGWWYFCFPIEFVENWTFPFFIRGDDSYFSLANNFEIICVNGIASHQEDFFVKQTPLTVYLDMRYHLLHHLVFERLRGNRFRDVYMMWRYFNRFNSSYHYESAAAINIAMNDVLAGPKFWEQNLDMSAKRKQIASIISCEKIQENLPWDPDDLVPNGRVNYNKFYWTIVRTITFNGHLLPKGFNHSKGRLMPLDFRANIRESFLRSYVVSVDIPSNVGYRVDKSLSKFFNNLILFLRLSCWLVVKHQKIQESYADFTIKTSKRRFWRDILK